ncbi:MAG: hypothetical protein V3T05_07245, partial [Myxococcota bacterium]
MRHSLANSHDVEPTASMASSALDVAGPKRASTRSLVLICLRVLTGLAPFLGKPFHIDDPMYVRAAERI